VRGQWQGWENDKVCATQFKSFKELGKMKRLTLVSLVAMVAMMIAISVQPAMADDGGAIFKAKCAGCHGADGAGKMGPALKGTALSSDQIVALLTKGDDAKKMPHKKALSGLSADDAKAVADYVKSLK
jgi:mono/diheme cytochrome c family protein